MNQTLNTVSIHTENIYAKNIVIVVIIIICLIPSKLKYDDTNDGLLDRTIPAVFDIAVKSVPQNSA